VAFRDAIELMAETLEHVEVDAVLGIEARGFLFGAPLALQLGASFVPVRKPGKLPAGTVRVDYALEYGTDALEMHSDALAGGARVIVVDDMLATGGTAAATVELARRQGAHVVHALFLMELNFLAGRKRLPDVPISSLLQFDAS
jgi:adenine phosphoribosyltransferase